MQGGGAANVSCSLVQGRGAGRVLPVHIRLWVPGESGLLPLQHMTEGGGPGGELEAAPQSRDFPDSCVT